MIRPELLNFLRCPLNPNRVRLVLEGENLVCEQCRLRFKIQDDLPVMVLEEAILPAGCDSISQLPCQKNQVSPPAKG